MNAHDALSVDNSIPRGSRSLVFVGFALSLLLPVLFATLIWYDLGRESAYTAERASVIGHAVQRHVRDQLGSLSDEMGRIADAASGASLGAPILLQSGSQNIVLRDIVLVRDGHAVDVQGRPALAGWLPQPDPAAQPTGLTIGAPVRDATSAHWMVSLAWDRQPGLRVGARIDADWFAAMLADYTFGDNVILNLLHRDGVLLARSLENQRYAGKHLDRSPIFDAGHHNLASGQFTEASLLDGIHRQFVFQRIPRTPLIIVVSTARSQILIAWVRFAAIAFCAALLLGGLWFWMSRAYARSNAIQSQLLQDLREQSRRAEEVRRVAGIGEWTWNLDSGEVTWSEEIFRMYGLEPHSRAMQVTEIPDRFHPDDRERVRGQIERVFAGGVPGEEVFRIVRLDGEVRTVYSNSEWVTNVPGRRLRGIQQDVTELAMSRRRLDEAQIEYRYLFQNNALPMWVFARDSKRFIAINDAALATYGYTHDEFRARSVYDLYQTSDADAVGEAVRMNSGADPLGTVWTHIRKDGSRLRVEIHARDLEFEGVPAKLVLALDVTERERNEQRFQMIARATSDAIWDWDIKTGAVWWSESFFTLFGYEHAEVAPILQGWIDRVHPDDVDRVTKGLHDAMESTAVEWKDQYRFRRGDGSYADVIDRGVLQRDAQGHVSRAVGGMLDITQKQQDEARLRLLRRAVEATESGILIADVCHPDMPAVYVNHAFEKMTGYSAGELLGKDSRALGFDERDLQTVKAIRRGLREHAEMRVLLRNKRKDGTLFWNDFYMAPVRDETGRVTHMVSVSSDVTERQRAAEQLAFRATHDELTGLPNRQLLMDRLQRAVLNAERHPRPVAVLFIDLDDFKLINDSLGHGSGDEALREIARRLETVVCDTDTAGRFGGDEFVILLTERADDEAVALAITRVYAELARPIDIAGVSHYINASIGWCRYPEAGAAAETLLMHADLAMYKAKQSGRNCVMAYQPEFDSQVSDRLRLVGELRKALQCNEFVLAFQPLFGMDGAPVALEALVRWQHPEHGLILPGHFIGVCEDSGLIVPLGRWVLHEAARHYAALAASGFEHLRIAVNVSALQFQRDLYADVESAMRTYGLPPGVLELELTESVIMASPDAAIDVMQRLDALGVSISVDDFGTGYSSLAYLKRLPIDRLKIDRTFVRDLASDEDDAAICTSIIGLAHSLELHTVAEGVETHAQLEWLRERGCDEVQGYLLGRPESFDVMLAALKKR